MPRRFASGRGLRTDVTELSDIAPGEPWRVEVIRGELVESRHRIHLAVADTAGRVVLRAGDAERAIYARSAIKPLQALAFVEAGAAEAYDLGDAEIALACASHSGEARHVATLAAWLTRIDCAPRDLECGSHMPYDWTATAELLRSGGALGPLHNNCSGKHAGFLTLARHQGWPTSCYIAFGHPVQQRVLGILEAMCGLDLSRSAKGVDGCGIPTIAIPLGNIALAMARLAVPDDQPDRRQAASARVRRAMAGEPYLVAGSDRFCTRVIEVTAGRALVKTGAEGVFAAAFPDLGLGAALKVEDGAGRAAEAAMAHLLQRLSLVGEAEAAALADLLEPPVTNRAGRIVGKLRVRETHGEG